MTRVASDDEAGAVVRPHGVMRADVPDGTSSTTSTKDEKTVSDGAGFVSIDDLRAAWVALVERQTERHKQPPVGIDGVRGEAFATKLDWNLAELNRVLNRRDEAGHLTYRFAPWLVRQLTPGGRSVYVPRVRDQLVLRVMAQQISQKMAARGISRGPPSQEHCARVLRLQLKRHGAWFFRADIKRFYENAPRATVLTDLAAIGCTADLIGLVAGLFETPARPPFSRRGDEVEVNGYPAGLSVSSLLAELVLARVDTALRAIGVVHLRYVDDILVIAANEEHAAAAESALVSAVEELKLCLSTTKTTRGPLADGVAFLGLNAGRGGVRLSSVRVERWLAVRQRELREKVLLTAKAEPPDARRILADLIANWNAELTGARGRLVAVAAAADDRETLSQVDRILRMMLAGVMRRLDVQPTGPFRLVSAEVWGHRWRCSPRATRLLAVRRFAPAQP